ncbi:MAG TPA: DUF2834 domain-containing protein [Thermoanaerobaculia bacterium]|nr:DUF2834 domain-containing protein [Thermoanaerobaculia bacterium]
MKTIYAALAVPGFLLPLSQLFRSGFDLFAPLRDPASSMFAFDLIISCVVFWTFVAFEKSVRHRWLYVLATLLVGLSFALPLFLFARERARVAS